MSGDGRRDQKQQGAMANAREYFFYRDFAVLSKIFTILRVSLEILGLTVIEVFSH